MPPPVRSHRCLAALLMIALLTVAGGTAWLVINWRHAKTAAPHWRERITAAPTTRRGEFGTTDWSMLVADMRRQPDRIDVLHDVLANAPASTLKAHAGFLAALASDEADPRYLNLAARVHWDANPESLFEILQFYAAYPLLEVIDPMLAIARDASCPLDARKLAVRLIGTGWESSPVTSRQRDVADALLKIIAKDPDAGLRLNAILAAVRTKSLDCASAQSAAAQLVHDGQIPADDARLEQLRELCG